MDITSIIIWFVVGWLLMQVILGVTDAMQIVKLKEQVEVLKHINGLIHQVKIEKIGETEYWFDEDDGEFLGQGKTIDEVISHVKSRFPDHIFLIKDLGGVAKQTDWKLIPPDEFNKVQLNVKDMQL